MERAIIGAILKNRIHEMGYTQEEFAEKCGIGYASLKKYIKGQNVYNYELMEIFAENLNCSYDYLMGKSVSPKRKNQDISNATRLSDEAIETLKKYAKIYNKNEIGKTFIETINVLIKSEELVEYLGIYLTANNQVKNEVSKYNELLVDMMESAININEEQNDIYDRDRFVGVDDMFLILLVSKLKDAREMVDRELTNQTINKSKYVRETLSGLINQDE